MNPELEKLVKRLATIASRDGLKQQQDYRDAKKSIEAKCRLLGCGDEYDSAVRMYIGLSGI